MNRSTVIILLTLFFIFLNVNIIFNCISNPLEKLLWNAFQMKTTSLNWCGGGRPFVVISGYKKQPSARDTHKQSCTYY